MDSTLRFSLSNEPKHDPVASLEKDRRPLKQAPYGANGERLAKFEGKKIRRHRSGEIFFIYSGRPVPQLSSGGGPTSGSRLDIE